MSYNRNYYLNFEVEQILCTAIFGEEYHQHVLCKSTVKTIILGLATLKLQIMLYFDS